MKCEGCGQELTAVDAIMCKYPVCGACVRERHARAVGKKGKGKGKGKGK